MRNLKRALSLALASVMLMGMMVVGASAASYPDVDADKHDIEAIDVLEAIGLMQGDKGTGNFRPDDKVTRNEMAVVMAKLILGTYEADSYTGVHPFTDVPSWADKYVAACYAAGIINGTSETTYSGTSNVTAVQAAAMMLRALGYEDLSKNAAKWDVPVAAKANQINLFKGMTGNGAAQLTRNEIAKLTLNTLQSDVVTTEREGAIEIPGVVSAPGKVTYTTVEIADRYAAAIDDTYGTGSKGYVVQLGEKLYKGDLKKNTETDDLGRPSTVWRYKNAEIIELAKEAELVYTSETKAADIQRDLRGYTVSNSVLNGGFDVEPQVNGVNSAATDTITGGTTTIAQAAGYIAALTGDGYTVTVYANNSGMITAVACIQEQLAKVLSINTAKDEITLQTSEGNKTIGEDDNGYANLAGKVAVNDYVLAVVGSDGEVKDAYVGEAVTGVVSRYTNKGEQTVDGTQYKVSACTFVGSELKAPADYANTVDEATLYLDSTGRVIGINNSKKLSSEDVCFVAFAKDVSTGGWGSAYEAYVYLPDGTKGVYAVSSINNSSKASDINTFATTNSGTGLYVYQISSDGKSIALKDGRNSSLNASDFQIVKSTTNDSVALKHNQAGYEVGKTSATAGSGTSVYMNSTTKFYMHNTTKAATINAGNAKDAITASTGLTSITDNTTLITSAAGDLHVAYRTVNGRAIAIAVYGKNASDVSAASEDLVFVTSGDWAKTDSAGEYYNVTAIFTGEEKDEEIVAKFVGRPATGLYTYKEDSDGRYELETAAKCAYKGILGAVDGEVLYAGSAQLNKLNADGVKIWDVTDSDKPFLLTGSDTLEGSNVYFGYAVTNNDSDKNVLAVYICKGDVTQVQAPGGSNTLKNDGSCALPAGTIVIGDKNDMNTATGAADNAPGDTAAIVYTVEDGDKNTPLTYTVKDIDGRTMWSEGNNGKAAGTWVWRISLEGLNGPAASNDATKLPWETKHDTTAGDVADNGSYTYTISTGTKTIASGSFVIDR